MMTAINPDHLITSWRQLTKALGQVANRTWEAESAAEAKMVTHVEAALIALLPGLAPDRRLMKGVLHSGSARLMEALLCRHGPAAYLAIHETEPFGLTEPIRRGDLAQLRLMHGAGFDLAREGTQMLRQIVRLQDPAYLSFLRDEIGETQRFVDAMPPDELILKYPQDYDASVRWAVCADILTAIGEAHAGLLRGMIRYGPGIIPMKFFALVLASGHPATVALESHLTPGARIPGEEEHPLARLAHLSFSNHGRLALALLEPSAEALLSRPHSGTFFGIASAEGDLELGRWIKIISR